MEHIPQIHILNFNHEYPITPYSHVVTIMLPWCHQTALLTPLLPLCCHHCHNAMLPCCYRHTTAIAMLLPPPRYCVHSHVATKVPPPPVPPPRHHRPHCSQAATTTKLLPLPLSTLCNRFDDEKEFCKMTDVDFFELSCLFQLGVEFLHRGMLPIFDALVCLLLNLNNL